MRRVLTVMLFVAVGAIGAGCGGGSADTDDAVAAVSTQPSPEAMQEQDAPVLDYVVVAPDGTEFDPPVKPEQIPDGAWYCDMGTVHFASIEHGDGTCPRCGMNLVHKDGEVGPTG